MSVDAPPQPRSRAKLWFFRLFTAVVIPAALLLVMEGALGIAGYGRPTGFLIPDAQPGWFRTNPEYTQLFLPAGFDLRPLNFRIQRAKPANTVRIVVLGESAAQGIPAPAFGFVPQLRAQLRARFPEKNIEVINTGVVAINSHVVYQIARDLVGFSPDLFVVYLGNNEVVGPYGPGCTYLSKMWPPWLVRFSGWVRTTRTGQLLAATVQNLSSAGGPPREWGGMAMFMDGAVRGDDPRLETVAQNYEANLRDIVGLARRAGAKTVLCTVVANLKDSPPFLSLHRPGLNETELAAWTRAFAQGKLAWQLGEHDAARARLLEAWRIDPHYADTAFLLGSVAQQSGDVAGAREYFLAALQWDALRFRPSPRLNEIARAVARDFPAVTLVDAARELGSDPLSSVPPAGRELFFEHVHPDWEGNHHLARLMAAGVEQALQPGSAATGSWLDATACGLAVGYTPHERFGVLQRTGLITQNPPFPNQLTYSEDQARMARAMAAAEVIYRDGGTTRRARETVQAALQSDPANPDLVKIAQELSDDLGDTEGALALVRRARTQQPDNFALATDEAIKLARLSRFDEAEGLLRTTAARCTPRELVKMGPAFADFYSRTKRFADGRRWFDEQVARFPAEANLRLARARLAQFAGDKAAAENDLQSVLSAAPDNQQALEALVAVLKAGGRREEAEALAVAQAGRQPGNQANNFRVAEYHESRGEETAAGQAYAAAAASGPVPAAIQLKIATAFYKAGRKPEALDHLATAWRLSRDEGDPAITDTIRALIERMRVEVYGAKP